MNERLNKPRFTVAQRRAMLKWGAAIAFAGATAWVIYFVTH